MTRRAFTVGAGVPASLVLLCDQRSTPGARVLDVRIIGGLACVTLKIDQRREAWLRVDERGVQVAVSPYGIRQRPVREVAHLWPIEQPTPPQAA